ncbi:unnamed protein product [Oreochromis niloticus]|nr:unnamed protein product [Mustela putorius furo]
MEACMMKPEVKKKPKSPRPPPKSTEIKRNEPQRPQIPPPTVPQRPTDSELSHTQYRLKKVTAAYNESNGNVKQQQTKDKPPETPVVPPRPTEKELNAPTRYSQRRTNAQTKDTESAKETEQPEAAAVPKDDADFKQGNYSVLTGLFHRSQKGRTPTFTSYMMNEEEKTDDVPVKQAPDGKPGVLKGVMKGLQFKSSPKASREHSPDPSAEEAGSENQQSVEKTKQEKNAEPKQEKGGLFAGAFWQTPKEKSSSPAVTVSKADSDAEDAEEEAKTSEMPHEKGGFLSGILKKPKKSPDETSTQENLSSHSELSASSDSLSENKEKKQWYSGMFKKPWKPTESPQTDQDNKADSGSEDVEEEEKTSETSHENLSAHSELSASSDSLSENKEKKRWYARMLKKSPKQAKAQSDQDQQCLHGDLPNSNDDLTEAQSKDKESLQTEASASDESTKDKESLQTEASASDDNSSTKEKGGVFRSMFRKSPKLSEGPRLEEGAETLHGELSASTDSLSENKEKGGLFSGLLRRSPKTPGEGNLSANKDVSDSSDSLTEAAGTKERGGAFGGMFKKSPKLADDPPTEEEKRPEDDEISGEGGVETTKEKGLFSGLLKKTPKASAGRTDSPDREAQKELLASSDDLSDNNITKEKNFLGKMFKKPQKPAESAASEEESEANTEAQLSASCENLSDITVTKEKKGGLAKILKRSGSVDNVLDEETNEDEEQKLSASDEDLSGANTATEKTGGLAGLFKKSPKPAPRSVATQDPLSRQLSASCDSLTDAGKEAALANSQLSASNDNLLEASSTPKEKKVGFSGITGMFRRTPKTEEQQEDEDMEAPARGALRRKRTIKKKRRVVSFRVKKTLPKIPKLGLTSQTSDKMPVIKETLEMQDMSPAQSMVEVQPVEMAAYPTEENPVETEPEEDELLEWWNTVKGWKEWNETSDFQAEDEEMAMEQAADRVYMAARLFVRLFNQRGASLQHRILELLAMADAADEFHKKTVSAAVGGGVASVAGSVTTITGLILAPFTFGASIIVTAVGIGVATAGSITSATANITDTVHSNMDRKKMEKMIQGYQEEIKVIRECMEFVQKGLDTLQEWDFEKYAQSAAKKAMNHNIKHVMKEGGRAGKALMINTNQLVSTVQVLGRAGGVAKAAQAISVTTGVMSALFLALDVFFLAKDSHELRKGAKTKFATKIREVCKDLQDGLLELNRVKMQLQKTMDGIEVEEFEEVEEVEVEVEDDLVSDPKKLAELEQELDLLEEKVDKKVVEVEEKGKEMEKGNSKIKKVKKEEKSIKEKDEKEKKEKSLKGKDGEKEKKEKEDSNDKDKEKMPDEEKEEKNKASGKTAKEEVLKQQSQKESKQDKNTKNRITAGNDNCKGKVSKMNDDIGTNKTTEKEKHKTRKEQEEVKSRSEGSKSERVKPERGSERRRSSIDDEGEVKPPESTSVNKEKTGDSSQRRHSSRSEKGVERGGEHLNRGTGEERQSRKGSEEDRGVKDWRAEMAKNREEKRQGQETENRQESHQDDEISSTKRRASERQLGGSREYSKRSHHRREHRERGDEKHGSRVESARRQFERAGGEEDDTKAKRKDDGESQRSNRERRGSERGREHEHSQPGQRARAKALLRDGLDI